MTANKMTAKKKFNPDSENNSDSEYSLDSARFSLVKTKEKATNILIQNEEIEEEPV